MGLLIGGDVEQRILFRFPGMPKMWRTWILDSKVVIFVCYAGRPSENSLASFYPQGEAPQRKRPHVHHKY